MDTVPGTGDGHNKMNSEKHKFLIQALLAVIAVGAFHAAYLFKPLTFLVAVSLYCLLMLSREGTPRKMFYTGLGVGMAMYGPQLYFFWTIFSAFAVVLWLILAFWLGIFLLLAHVCHKKYGIIWAAVLAPFLWLGIEYFRGELYYLRFTWLTPGFAFAHAPWRIGMHWLGVYGIGFALMAAAAAVSVFKGKKAIGAGVALLGVLVILSNIGAAPSIGKAKTDGPLTAGIQLEFPSPKTVLSFLIKTLDKNPDIDLFALSEYVFDGPVPEKVRDWCRKEKKYLIAGGREQFGPGKNDFFNTAFVIGPDGSVVFKQVKCVPVQFFADGVPAKEQRLWDSPWGKIGICICYDFSYTRVTDKLVRMGAQGLIVPTMDVIGWGRHQHNLHGRVGPVRAAEYGVPVFRVCSSGISQYVTGDGQVRETAPFPGQGETLIARIKPARKGSLPLDRYLAPLSTVITALFIVWLLIAWGRKKL